MSISSSYIRRATSIVVIVGAAVAANGQAWLTGGLLDFNGLVSGKSGEIDYSTDSGGSWTNNQGLGFMSWDVLNAAALPLNGLGGATSANGLADTSGIDLYTICAELEALSDPQFVDAWWSDDVLLGAARNRAGSVAGANFGGVSAFEHAFTGSDAADRAVGFQIAVWAARYGGGAGPLDITHVSGHIIAGSFRVRDSGTGGWSDIKTYAKMYYDAAYSAWSTGNGYHTSIFLDGANTSGPDQDQLTWDFDNPPQSVPEPFTMALGVAAAGAYVRRRLKGQAPAKLA